VIHLLLDDPSKARLHQLLWCIIKVVAQQTFHNNTFFSKGGLQAEVEAALHALCRDEDGHVSIQCEETTSANRCTDMWLRAWPPGKDYDVELIIEFKCIHPNALVLDTKTSTLFPLSWFNMHPYSLLTFTPHPQKLNQTGLHLHCMSSSRRQMLSHLITFVSSRFKTPTSSFSCRA